MPTGQEQLELAVLQSMARRARPENAAALKSQIVSAKVVSRDFTGVGFFTNYEVPEDTVPFPPSRFEGIAHITLEDWGLYAGARFRSGSIATFILAIGGGRLSHLEGLMLESEQWPDDVSSFEVDA